MGRVRRGARPARSRAAREEGVEHLDEPRRLLGVERVPGVLEHHEARAALSRSGLRERDPDAFWRRAFELSVAGYFKEPARASNLTPFRVAARAQQAVWQSLEGMDLRARLHEIAAETLVLHGRHDPIPLAASEELVAALPRARLVVFEDSGHALYTEETDRFARVLDDFLPRAP